MSEHHRTRRRFAVFLTLALMAAAVAIAVFMFEIMPRVRARETLQAQTSHLAAPVVSIIHPTREAAGEEVVLPGNIQAFIDAPIYARTSGYLRHWYFDIGARVKRGEQLADIESPEVDEQLRQGQGELAGAEANLKLSELTADRYLDLFKTDSVSKQEVDNAVQDRAAKEQTVRSAKANVVRLEKMVGFEKLYAPFDGVITARNTDIGQLIEAGSAGGPTRELFHVASVDKLRVFVNVPQVYSHSTVRGMKADLTLQELPGKRFTGTLNRTADSIDQATRTLLVEVDVDNKAGQLFPGAYTQVHFKIKPESTTLIVPSTCLIFRADGLQVATIKEGTHASLIPVTMGRDFGKTVELVAGLLDTTAIIADPPDSLVDGEVVRVAKPAVVEDAEK